MKHSPLATLAMLAALALALPLALFILWLDREERL